MTSGVWDCRSNSFTGLHFNYYFTLGVQDCRSYRLTHLHGSSRFTEGVSGRVLCNCSFVINFSILITELETGNCCRGPVLSHLYMSITGCKEVIKKVSF